MTGALGGQLSWGQVLEYGRTVLREAGIAEADLDAWYLFERAFGIGKARYFLCAGERSGAGESDLEFYEEMLKRRAGRVPLQHILGTQEFMGLTFFVNGDVLIPRQDTETLVETVLSENRDESLSLLDMCTGSGCIGVSLAALGGFRHVEAADISGRALLVAERNAEAILGPGRIRFRKSDLFSAFEAGERFDILASNPPYIPSAVIGSLEPEVRDFEPVNALDGAADGLLFYRRLAAESPKFLKDGGRIYLEIGYDQGEAVSSLLSESGFQEIRVIKDLAGKDRVVSGRRRAL